MLHDVNPRIDTLVERVHSIRRDRLRILLETHGQTGLGLLTHITPAYLYQMGKGEGAQRRGISDDTAAKIERATGLTPGWLSGVDKP